MWYKVEVQEVYIQTVEIEADSPEEAISKVADNDEGVETNDPQYSYTLEPDTWKVEEDK